MNHPVLHQPIDFDDLPIPDLDAALDMPMQAPALIRSNALTPADLLPQVQTKKRKKASTKKKKKEKRSARPDYDSDYDRTESDSDCDLPPAKPKRTKKPRAPRDPNKPPSTHRWQMHLRAFRAENQEACAGKSCAVISKLARVSYQPRPKCPTCNK